METLTAEVIKLREAIEKQTQLMEERHKLSQDMLNIVQEMKAIINR